MKDLKKKNVLITGAASGIGRALAGAFAAEGADLVLADIDGEGLDETARALEGAGVRVVCARADISRLEEVKALAGKAADDLGGVDVLVNNAGVCQVAAMEDLEIEDWTAMIGVNLWGAVGLVHYLLPQMIKAGSGHIVNIASGAGLVGFPNMVPYSTTKFAMVGFSEALTAELAGYNIRVTAVCPGVISTPIIRKSEIRGFNNVQQRRNTVHAIGMSPEKAARIIVRAVMKDKPLLVLTAPMKILWFMKRLSPGLARLLAGALARRMSLDRAK